MAGFGRRILTKARKGFLAVRFWGIKKLARVSVDAYMKAATRYWRGLGIDIQGTPKFINPGTDFDGSDYSRIHIGDNVTISAGVMFLTHDYSITTGSAALGRPIARHEGELFIAEPVSIGRNCFIGARTTILPGATIGDNVIIGACSVVKGTIPDNSVAAGNPCRVLADTIAWTEAKLKSENVMVEAPDWA